MTPLNISYYLYPNDYNPSICTFSFNRYLLLKRHFWYISKMKGYILSTDAFSYIYIYIYMWNLNFHKENSNTLMFHFIHFTNEYSLTLYHYYNLLLYIPIYIQHFPRENHSSWLLVPTTYLVSIHFGPSWSTPSSSGIC